MGPGEGAFFMAEQFTVDGALGNGTAVHRDVRPMLARTVGVQDLGQHFLAAPALALDQHAQVGRGHLGHVADGTVQPRRGTDDAEALLDGLHVHAVAG